MQRGCRVVTAYILYGNLAVSGKNVKLTSREGRLTETNEERASSTGEWRASRRAKEEWKLPLGVRFTSVAGEKKFTFACLYLSLSPALAGSSRGD